MGQCAPFATGWFGDGIGRIQKDTTANVRTVVGFSEALIEVELLASLRVIEGREGFIDSLLQLNLEFDMFFPGRCRCVVVVAEGELRWRA